MGLGIHTQTELVLLHFSDLYPICKHSISSNITSSAKLGTRESAERPVISHDPNRCAVIWFLTTKSCGISLFTMKLVVYW